MSWKEDNETSRKTQNSTALTLETVTRIGSPKVVSQIVINSHHTYYCQMAES